VFLGDTEDGYLQKHRSVAEMNPKHPSLYEVFPMLLVLTHAYVIRLTFLEMAYLTLDNPKVDQTHIQIFDIRGEKATEYLSTW
jgi:hypothetical protein